MHFMMFILFIILYPLVSVLQNLKINFINKAIRSILVLYQYEIFLRLWIQSYLELSVSAIISISYTNFSNLTQLIDTTVSVGILVIFYSDFKYNWNICYWISYL